MHWNSTCGWLTVTVNASENARRAAMVSAPSNEIEGLGWNLGTYTDVEKDPASCWKTPHGMVLYSRHSYYEQNYIDHRGIEPPTNWWFDNDPPS